jgi:hypothetical protein
MRPKNHFIAHIFRSKGKESTEKNAAEAFAYPSPPSSPAPLLPATASPPLFLGVTGGGIVPPPVSYKRGGGIPINPNFPLSPRSGTSTTSG